MGLIEDLLGGRNLMQLERPYWAVKLRSGRFLSEASTKVDIAHATERRVDWTLDLVTTGDTRHIEELWLLCPPSPTSPTGNTARLGILEPETAFQFKCKFVGMNGSGSGMAAMVVGRVDDRATGECTCFVWDCEKQALYHSWKPNLYAASGMGTWRDGGIPIGRQSLSVLGVREP